MFVSIDVNCGTSKIRIIQSALLCISVLIQALKEQLSVPSNEPKTKVSDNRGNKRWMLWTRAWDKRHCAKLLAILLIVFVLLPLGFAISSGNLRPHAKPPLGLWVKTWEQKAWSAVERITINRHWDSLCYWSHLLPVLVRYAKQEIKHVVKRHLLWYPLFVAALLTG